MSFCYFFPLMTKARSFGNGSQFIFGTVNAYTAGMSRVIYAVARDGGFPQFLHHLNPKTGVPDRSLVMLFGLSMLVLSLYFFAGVDLETALLIPSGAAILVYVIGSAAGIKLLRGGEHRSIFPWLSLIMSIAILPFVGLLALVPVITALAALVFMRLAGRKG